MSSVSSLLSVRFLQILDFSYAAFIMLRYFPSSPIFARTFILKACWIFSIYRNVIFFFKPIYAIYYTYWVVYVEPSLIFGIKPKLNIVDNIFDVYLFSSPKFYSIFWRLFHQKYWPVVSFFVYYLSGFGIRVILASWMDLGNAPSVSAFWVIEQKLAIDLLWKSHRILLLILLALGHF